LANRATGLSWRVTTTSFPLDLNLRPLVAETYLKRFTNEKGDSWVLDRRTAEIRRQRPEVTAAERELYTLDLPEAPDRRVETLLAETIDPHAAIHRPLFGLVRTQAREKGIRMPGTSDRYAAFRLSLEQQRRRAKDLLRAVRVGDSAARRRLADALAPCSDAAAVKLTDAQFAIARLRSAHAFTQIPVSCEIWELPGNHSKLSHAGKRLRKAQASRCP
jgi:hypothetical protein